MVNGIGRPRHIGTCQDVLNALENTTLSWVQEKILQKWSSQTIKNVILLIIDNVKLQSKNKKKILTWNLETVYTQITKVKN